jgi:NADPH:quinone reductase-like Zn-dependent oxidoreductase
MQRVVVHRPGSYERLQLESGPAPGPAAGEVRVRVAAAGVNYADVIVRMGLYASAKKYVGWPITPGFEFAGAVDQIGPDVSGFAIGDPIFGVTRFGAYASQLCVPAHQLFPLPDGVSPVEAASLPVVFLTAYYALFELVHPRPGDRALVHSAAGGVGTALLQLLKIAGCESVGVVGGAHKINVAKAAGADAVINKRDSPLWPRVAELASNGFQSVFDANGAETLRHSYRSLAPAGKLVVYGFHTMLPRRGGKPRWGRLIVDYLRTPRFNPLDLTTDNKSVLAFNLSFLFDHKQLLAEAMQKLAGWLAEGSYRPQPIQTFSLADVASAHRVIESGNTVGKLVLVVD